MIEDGFKVLININKIVDESLRLSKRAKIAIEEAKREISIDREL